MRERFGPGLCLQPCGGSTAGLGCPAGGTAAALTLIAGRRVAKKINNKLVQPIAPFLPGELLEDGGGGGGGTACSSQGLCTVHGGKTQLVMALCQHSRCPASPQQQSAVTGTHGTRQAGQSPATPTVLRSRSPGPFHSRKIRHKNFAGRFATSLPSCPSYPLSKLKLFLAALLQYVSPSGS